MLVVVTPSSSTSCSASAASTCGTVTSVPCSDAVPIVATTQLARWNIGSTASHTGGCLPAVMRSAACAALFAIPTCGSTAPLGLPVVPDV